MLYYFLGEKLPLLGEDCKLGAGGRLIKGAEVVLHLIRLVLLGCGDGGPVEKGKIFHG